MVRMTDHRATVAEAAETSMNDEHPPNPEAPATEVVTPGPVTGWTPETLGETAGPVGVASVAGPMPAQARWARIGLLGIGAAAIIAAAALAFGSVSTPTGTLAAGSGSTGSTSTNGVQDLNGGPGGPGLRFGHGGPGFGGITITAISGSSISLETEDGWTRTITVDDGTTYTKAGADITLGDLAVGDTIGFRQTLEDDGTWTIDAVAVILPHVGGEVTAVDGSTVTVTLRDDTAATVNIGSDANIVVNGDAATLADIKVGMVLVAEGTKNDDGSLTATRVKAGDAGLRGDGFGGRGFFGPGFGDGDGGKPDATTAPEATDSAS
jgi:Domain of unknown function (DUF5666)